ncbi:alpha/beta hydrolase [Phycicoccus endophyticus]|uniref:Alpha/beta hydrolase n=1 Tax=Phycicoccus endophyticus TaxID=1690220 RepID=A0A7G9R2M9_9MICO|nr:alpha/beta hydrolase [Phycicoccus endophyticus]NHI20681.1 alpha/beta hydrolase [Phycicoccus endophyticus]QNN49854.1 alpha/beta hydrolase [Phycicoccus endophyticus]GGL35771.1 hypothetical protein GCM10012283_17720 [Phycicoccus endophyticus]
MESSTTTVTAQDGTRMFTRCWLPDGAPTGVVVVVHGMAEHSGRYARLAEALVAGGYAVYAADLRGHGRTATEETLGHFADADGWASTVADLRAVTATAAAEHPEAPLFLLGHSMGSELSRAYVIEDSSGLAGLVLSGTVGNPGPAGRVGRGIAAAEARLRGGRHRSALLDRLVFGQYNAAFRPARTDFDWLSREESEVDAYVADPLCGTTSTSRFFVDLLGGVAGVNDPERVARVRADLPVLLVGGAEDPAGHGGRGPREVGQQYRNAGLTDVTCTIYPQARHELFNETNRDEVTADVLAWLDAHLPS